MEGESVSHPATVEVGMEDEWLVNLPATMGEGRIVYRVTTSNGDFDVVQPWLTMGTIPPEFDGSLIGARAQGFAGAFMIIALMVAFKDCYNQPEGSMNWIKQKKWRQQRRHQSNQ